MIRSLASRSFSQVPRGTYVLGLESSADDTCVAIVSGRREILSNVVIKQNHEQDGGIMPIKAQDAHFRNMPVAIDRALSEARLRLDDISAIAFTRGPGMFGCLSVCATSARALAAATRKSLIGVHHMQAHALTPFLTEKEPPAFPFLTLLASGGHTMLLLATAVDAFEILANCKDETMGRLFDKTARDLKIPWSVGDGSAGRSLDVFSELATCDVANPPHFTARPNSLAELFPVPFHNELAFSFSGAHSAVDRLVALGTHPAKDIAQAVIVAAVRQIESKVLLALQKHDVKTLVISGGVASNSYLRRRIAHVLPNIRCIYPPVEYCTDNAAMIAYVGLSRLERNKLDPLDVMQCAKWDIRDCESVV